MHKMIQYLQKIAIFYIFMASLSFFNTDFFNKPISYIGQNIHKMIHLSQGITTFYIFGLKYAFYTGREICISIVDI